MTNLYTGPGNPWAEQPENDADDQLPNGHSRNDYHRVGISDGDIEYWGLDQSGAPSPDAAGWVIGEMIEEMGW